MAHEDSRQPSGSPMAPAGDVSLGDSRRPLLPALTVLGMDLTKTSSGQRCVTLGAPFAWAAAYFIFASQGWWAPAVAALMCLSFVTYGSTSHDLVHRNLGISRRANDILLCLIELLMLRSGHAYRLAHLHHHARYPHDDDIEGRAAKLSFVGALLDGVTLQQRVWLWALRHAKTGRSWIVCEGGAALLMGCAAVALCPYTAIPLIYAVLIVMGSWIIPLITAYIPHDPRGPRPLFQTRLFRGL